MGISYEVREINTDGDVMLDFSQNTLVSLCFIESQFRAASLVSIDRSDFDHLFHQSKFPAGTMVVLDTAKYHGDEKFLQDMVSRGLMPCFLPAYRFGE
jgi:hypothetical protein